MADVPPHGISSPPPHDPGGAIPHRVRQSDPQFGESLRRGRLGTPIINDAATTSPTTTDDISLNYSRGSLWMDKTNNDVWICLDATRSAAVWQRLVASGLSLATAIASPTLSGDKFTLTAPWNNVAPESGTADNLSWITGGRAGLFAFVRAVDGATLTVKHLAGGGVAADRIATRDGADFTLASVAGQGGEWALFFHATLWLEIFRSMPTRYSVVNYVFTPDAAPQTAITASTTDPQGTIHHSGPAAEIATKFYVDAETAPGTNSVLKVKYANADTLDGSPSWTEIATLTITDKGINTPTMTNATIPADSIIALFVDSISGTGAKDVTATLRVKRPLSS